MNFIAFYGAVWFLLEGIYLETEWETVLSAKQKLTDLLRDRVTTFMLNNNPA